MPSTGKENTLTKFATIYATQSTQGAIVQGTTEGPLPKQDPSSTTPSSPIQSTSDTCQKKLI